VENARYEVPPTARVEDEIGQHVPPGHTITVTASPTKGLEATLVLSERLARLGYDVVPHLAALGSAFVDVGITGIPRAIRASTTT